MKFFFVLLFSVGVALIAIGTLGLVNTFTGVPNWPIFTTIRPSTGSHGPRTLNYRGEIFVGLIAMGGVMIYSLLRGLRDRT